MKGVVITLCVLLILWLVGRIRIAARAEYCQDGFFLWLLVARLHIQILPASRKRRVKSKKSTHKTGRVEKPKEEQEKKRGGSLETVCRLIPVAVDALKTLRRKIRADLLRLRLTIAADDPADAAIRYGQASALLGALWQPLIHALNVVDGEAKIDVDFQAGEPAVYMLAQLSLTVGQTVALGVVFGLKALAALLRGRRAGGTGSQRKEVE